MTADRSTSTVDAAAAFERGRHPQQSRRDVGPDDWREDQHGGRVIYARGAWGDPFVRGGLTDEGRAALGVTA